MRSCKRKTPTENDVQTAEVVKYVKALLKAARTKTNKKTRSSELPRTVEVTTEYLNALRRAVGQLIDPETAEVNWRHVGMLDPYGDYENCRRISSASMRSKRTDAHVAAVKRRKSLIDKLNVGCWSLHPCHLVSRQYVVVKSELSILWRRGSVFPCSFQSC